MEEVAEERRITLPEWAWILVLLGIILVLSLIGPPEAPVEEALPVVPSVTVRFWVEGEVVASQQVAQGECPQAVAPQIRGLSFRSWQDGSGQPVTPQSIPVWEDTDYEAVVYPRLSEHAPYLFPDGEGNLRPQAVLTANEFTRAIRALAEEGAEDYLPTMPLGNWEMDKSHLTYWLELLYSPQAARTAMEVVEEGPVKRGDFARIMNRLLGRGGGQTVVVAQNISAPRDLSLEGENWEAVLEAALPHTHDASGGPWAEAVLELCWEPGFFFLDGRLCYADGSGHMIRNAQVGDLEFGDDGRYTSGDPELDELVTELLVRFMEENPQAEREELLRIAYLYCRDSFMYLNRGYKAFGETDWQVESAKVMLQTGMGNCYYYSAAFWALARGLGYPAFAVSGGVLRYGAPHSWVGIYFDGVRYSFDPELEMSYRTERGEPEADFYKLGYYRQLYYKYVWPSSW